ncbi:transcription factor Adf-1 [Schistocerca serialis cubense]|uniref:transcription factor Adf-1 n=1 Tax=Schistocerca serialis cubense TaxID=2023355 RepID=UPI00214E1CA0|nr:transcription factor Adf-1 [Schistocerca serialis cubense]
MSHSQDVMLCELVSQHPCLYDLKNPKYRDTMFRDRIWEEIGAQLKLAGMQLQKKWRNIKDSYNREKRRLSGKSGSAVARNTQYLYFNLLSFLNITSPPVHTHSSVSPETIENQASQESEAASGPYTG